MHVRQDSAGASLHHSPAALSARRSQRRASTALCASHPTAALAWSLQASSQPQKARQDRHACAKGWHSRVACRAATMEVGTGVTQICTSIVADTVDGALQILNSEAAREADLIELRLDFYQDFPSCSNGSDDDVVTGLRQLLAASGPERTIVTYRPAWEGCEICFLVSRAPVCTPCRLPARTQAWPLLQGPLRFHAEAGHAMRAAANCKCWQVSTCISTVAAGDSWGWCRGKYDGPEDARLRVLRLACAHGARFVDVELLAARTFLQQNGAAMREAGVRAIVSHHNFERTLSLRELQTTEAQMRALGADIAKLAMTAADVSEAWTMLRLLQERQGAHVHAALCGCACPCTLQACMHIGDWPGCPPCGHGAVVACIERDACAQSC